MPHTLLPISHFHSASTLLQFIWLMSTKKKKKKSVLPCKSEIQQLGTRCVKLLAQSED